MTRIVVFMETLPRLVSLPSLSPSLAKGPSYAQTSPTSIAKEHFLKTCSTNLFASFSMGRGMQRILSVSLA
ncbi:hypothetical protein E1A91_D10G101100v1 [Gossypium mustelinum]|uniref:Uncharacterized protein n=1 Tax=Gossypium mustelinum TaxID=34275 RepID=A0A5D2T8C4_GOSMU|nr:hypothetical protein E1A91_D10G101100v1 [Gossypium mustelinum]